MLAAEPRMKQIYGQQYAHVRSGWNDGSSNPVRVSAAEIWHDHNASGHAARHDESERSGAASGDRAFRCAECYHLFGVDLCFV